MKLIVPIIATANCAEVFLSVSETAAPVMSRTPRNAERRMFQLEEQIEDWIAEAGVGPFDKRNLWAYGCHCQFLGDRPLSEMGIGQPKDQIDSYVLLCKKILAYYNLENRALYLNLVPELPNSVWYSWLQ